MQLTAEQVAKTTEEVSRMQDEIDRLQRERDEARSKLAAEWQAKLEREYERDIALEALREIEGGSGECNMGYSGCDQNCKCTARKAIERIEGGYDE